MFLGCRGSFRKADGVLETGAGYTGGTLPDPGYEQVESGTTGHTGAADIVFESSFVSYDQLLDLFWNMHNPMETVGQG
jgi:peptide-methionine (S)-S-oxide reductase